MGQLGSKLTAFGDKMEKRFSDIEARELDTEYSKILRQLEFGDGTQQNPGYYSLQGKQALQDHDRVAQEAEKKLNDLLGRASGGLSREAFSVMARRRLNSTLDKMNRHRASAFLKVEKDSSIARQAEAMQGAVANSMDPVEVKKHIDVVRFEARQRAMKENGDAAFVKTQTQKAVSSAHLAVINDLQNRPGGAKLAERYFEVNKGEIDPNVRQDTLQKIQTTGRVQLSQEEGDRVSEQYDLSTPEGAEAALDDVRNKHSDKDETDVVTAVKARIAEAKAIKTAKERDLRLSAIQKGEEGKWNEITAEEKAALLATPGGMTFLQTGPQKRADAIAGRDQSADVEETARLNRMDDGQLVEVDLTTPEAVRKLGKTHGYWMRQQKAAMDRLRAGQNVGRTPTQIRAAVTKKMNDATAAEFGARFDQELEALTAGKPKGFKPSPTEVQKIADRLTLQMRRENSSTFGNPFGVDDTGTLFRMSRKDGREFEVDDVEENHDNLSRMFGITMENARGLIATTKKLKGKATLENIRKVVEAARRKAEKGK